MEPEDKDHYFGEWVEYQSEEEKLQAIDYLALWQKFFLRKIPELEYIENHLVCGPDCLGENKSTLGLKLRMRGKKPDNVLSLDQLPI